MVPERMETNEIRPINILDFCTHFLHDDVKMEHSTTVSMRGRDRIRIQES